MRFELIQTEWARLLMGTLARAGVERVVVSPGSRSTPFVVAAHREPGLRVTAVADERSAAFFALGIGRATGRPAVLLRTSGTAAAHDYPAVIEAAEDHVPLLVLSADRPFELQSSGAPQTTDQRRLFGSFVRFDAELGIADPVGLAGLARTVAQAVFRAGYPLPGPVHLNARARKPLEPVAPQSDAEQAVAAEVDRQLRRSRRYVAPSATFEASDVADVVPRVAAARRGALVAGPLPPDPALPAAVRTFTRQSGFALYAEAGSQLRSAELRANDDFDWARPDADVAILLGRHPSSRALQALLRRAETLITAHPHAPVDPDGAAEQLVEGPLAGWLLAVAAALPEPGPPEREPSGGAWARVEAALEAAPFSEAHAVRAVSRRPDDSALFLGNSLALRLFDRFVPAGEAKGPVFTQRGVNGIDGHVSCAAGIATALGRATAAVLGDVALAHDIGGLAVAAEVETPLVLVVLDNGGGRIFEELPLVSAVDDPGLVDLFTTPARRRWDAAGAAFGVPSVRVADLAALEAALDAAWRRPGPTLVHVVVPEQGAVALDRRIRGGDP